MKQDTGTTAEKLRINTDHVGSGQEGREWDFGRDDPACLPESATVDVPVLEPLPDNGIGPWLRN